MVLSRMRMISVPELQLVCASSAGADERIVAAPVEDHENVIVCREDAVRARGTTSLRSYRLGYN